MTVSKRLLVATPLYPPEPGGPATYAHVLAHELPLHGVSVDMVKFSDVRHLPKVFRHLAYGWKVYVGAKDADLILALDCVSVGFPALIASFVRRKPFYVKMVGDYAWEQGRQRFGITQDLEVFVRMGRVSMPVALLRMIQTYVASSARHVLVPSHYLEHIVSTWGIPATKIHVVYNAVESEEVGSHSSSMPLPHPSILCIGRLVPWKHVDAVIDAVALMTQEGTPATLVVVGTGPQETVLRKYATQKGVPVQFMGALGRAETQRILAQADVLVLNSSYEGLSHVLIEGIQQGKAIVATKAGGNGEVITDDVNGLLVSPHDTVALAGAVTRILSDSAVRTRLEEGARASSGRFTIEAMVLGTCSVLGL